MTPVDRLRAQNAEFEKAIVRLNDRTFLAVGYAASNVALLLGDGGAVVVDATESTSTAREILNDFRALTSLPIRTIVLTHGHRDHIGGVSVFAGPDTEIIAHARFASHLGSRNPVPSKLGIARTRRQFGVGLAPGSERINVGISLAVSQDGAGAGFLEPTRYIEGSRETVETCGLRLTMIAAPGETPDQMVVWHEADHVLFCADNYYSAFPNLYAIAARHIAIFRSGLKASTS